MSAYDDGLEAGKLSVYCTWLRNPYNPGSIEWQMWEAGFETGRTIELGERTMNRG